MMCSVLRQSNMAVRRVSVLLPMTKLGLYRPHILAVNSQQLQRFTTSLTEGPTQAKGPERKKPKGIWNTVTSWFAPNSQALGAYHIFQRSLTHSQHPNFYDVCKVNHDFMGLVSIITLHVWMIHTRIKSDAYDQKGFVHHLYEQAWLDIEKRLKDEGINAWLLNKHLNEVQQVVIGSLMTYDVTFQTYQKTEDCKPFLGALWRNIYAGDVELDRAKLVQLRDYVFQELDNVMYTHEDMFYEGRIEWGLPPSELATPTEESELLDISLAQKPMFKSSDKYGTWT